MEAEDLVLNNSGEWQVIKELSEVFPDGWTAIFPEALIVEAINLGNLSGLVVSSQDSDSVSIPDLQGNKECHSLDTVIASINVISHEEIIRVWWLASNFE